MGSIFGLVFLVFFAIYYYIDYLFSKWVKSKVRTENAFWLTFIFGVGGAIFACLLAMAENTCKSLETTATNEVK